MTVRSPLAALVVLAVLASGIAPCPAVLVTDAPAPVVHHHHDHGRHDPRSPTTAARERSAPGSETVQLVIGVPCPCGCGQHSKGIHVQVSQSPFLPPHVADLGAPDARACPSCTSAGAPDAPAARVFHVPISV